MHNDPHARPCSGPEPRQETELESRVRIVDRIDAASREFYRRAILTVQAAGIPLLVGGAFAFERYTGVSRHTKDFDIFIRARDTEPVLEVLKKAGFNTEITAPHWLAKVCEGDSFVDIIFSEANGVNAVDDEWFDQASREMILGMDLAVCPVEEMICSKAFVMDRDRYDGADVAHLIRACAERLDWDRILRRFGPYWHVLLSHLLLFLFIYPSERARIPEAVLQELLGRVQKELKTPPPRDRICRGTLVSMTQYRIDTLRWGYTDARELRQAV
ncbi:MAG: hypothetical protein A2010_06520 [Nitrospirae bacterium GWD2_57_9]|nr:MAG: hypothetical protein A2010_06520 [Nitrospirae bacterium GWD2_57_9]OGW45922.1 MAG: hypothetical protein A2078_16370 [Nitrospirae bacterium GWC2_57_9]